MKKLTTLLAVLFAATLAYGGEGKDKDRDTTKEITKDVKDAAKDVKNEVKDKTGETTAEAKAESKEAKAKLAKNSHEVEAEVVSVDSVKNTVTIKTTKGESTAPVEGKAQISLKDLKPGQKVTVVCRDDDMGAHKAVTDIKTSDKK